MVFKLQKRAHFDLVLGIMKVCLLSGFYNEGIKHKIKNCWKNSSSAMLGKGISGTEHTRTE